MEDANQHFVGKVSQKTIIQHLGKVLVQKGSGDTVWDWPGGHLHIGEVPAEGLKREIKEELGLSVEGLLPLIIERCLHIKSNTWRVVIFYTCVSLSLDFTLDPSEVDEAKWVSKEELKTLPMFDDSRSAADVFLKA